MRRQGFGKIVNIGSMGGVLTFPGGGIYHSTKYAVEAISDALRFEVKGFGVDVVLVQPGLIKTEFSEAAVSSIGSLPASEGPYGDFTGSVAKATKEAYEKGPLAVLGGDGEDVAKVIETALKAKCPKARYRVTLSAHLLMTQRALMPDGIWDLFLATQFPRPRQEKGNG
jgi:short-subunit dehydrogenase